MTMRRTISSRARSAVMPAIAVSSAFLLAGLNDRAIASAAAHEAPAWHAFGIFVSRFGLSAYMLGLAAVLAGGAGLVVRSTGRREVARRARRLAEGAVFVFVAVAASGLVCQALKHVIGRARPRFLDLLGAYDFAGPTLHSGFESFPSGHSTNAFAAATALTLLRPAAGVVVYPAAVLICLARILAEAHFPSDTLAGALLGTIVTYGVARAFAKRDVAFTVSDPLPLSATGRTITRSEGRDARAL